MQGIFSEFIRHFRTLIADIFTRKKAYLGLIAGIVTGLIICALLVSGFYELLEELNEEELAGFDDSIAIPIHLLRNSRLTEVMLVITWMGDQTAYIIFSLALFVFFYIRYRSLIFPLQTSVVLLFAGGLNRWLKGLIARPRPSAEHLVEAGSMSFPSGHAMSSIAFFGFLIYLVWRLVSTPWLRWLLSFLLVFLTLAIGFSRVYLGVHYPSDVLAGYAAGGACLAIFISVYVFVRYRYVRKGKAAVNLKGKGRSSGA